MIGITLILVFILGTSLGSFIGVIIDRIKSGKKGIFLGRSECPNCKKQLKTKDLVPIFSYIFLKGVCRYCGKDISPHYLAMEVLSGLTMATLFFRFQFIIENGDFTGINYGMLLSFIAFTIYCLFFIGIFFYDLQHSKIPDLFLFPLIGITLIGSLIMGTPPLFSILIAVAIALIFYGGQYLLSKGKWLGSGDVYLAIAIAIILGWQLFLVSIIITYIIGGIIAATLLVAKKVTGKSHVPFAPFMILGTLLTIFFGMEILDWYLRFIYL